jgi:photosystem II stability/assembly factor-like uncharacterized protein
MKYIQIALVLLSGCFISPDVHAQWAKVASNVKTDLNSVGFASVNSGWIVGDAGVILKKVGDSWTSVESPVSEDLNAIRMVSEGEGWIVGNKGTILHYSTDGWVQFESPTSQNLYDVQFIDNQNGFAVGADGTLLRFQNQMWYNIPNDYRINFYSIAIRDNNLWIGGNHEGTNVPILKVEIGLENEPLQKYSTDMPINSLSISDVFSGWAVGGVNQLLYFNGNSWKRTALPKSFSSLKSVYFQDINTGIAVGYAGSLLSYNEGVWTKEDIPTPENLNAAQIISDRWFAVGDGGTILEKKIATTSKKQIAIHMESGISIYPNPCDESLYASVMFDSEEADLVYSIVNASGALVEKKEMMVFTPVANLTIPTSTLENGTYLITFTGKGLSKTLPFIVQH